jgi:hypothetical protein
MMRLWKTRFGGFFHFKEMTIYNNSCLSIHVNHSSMFMDDGTELPRHNDAEE